MSTNVQNLKQIGGGHRKNGQKFVDLTWIDPISSLKLINFLYLKLNALQINAIVVLIANMGLGPDCWRAVSRKSSRVKA